MSYYFWIDLLSLSIPLIATFDRRLQFQRNWKYLLPAMTGTMLIFIPWDIYKTAAGVWGFNPRYLQGITIVNLPAEEWLFFIAIPYACMFTYHAFEYLIKKDYLSAFARPFTLALIATLAFVAALNPLKTYTFVTFAGMAVFLALHVFVFRVKWLGRFYMMYFATLIPFFIVNGALTGSFTPEPVVWYDNTRNLGIRLGTIPVEDTIYGMFMLLLNTTIYEWLRTRCRTNLSPAAHESTRENQLPKDSEKPEGQTRE